MIRPHTPVLYDYRYTATSWKEAIFFCVSASDSFLCKYAIGKASYIRNVLCTNRYDELYRLNVFPPAIYSYYLNSPCTYCGVPINSNNHIVYGELQQAVLDLVQKPLPVYHVYTVLVQDMFEIDLRKHRVAMTANVSRIYDLYVSLVKHEALRGGKHEE